MVKRNTRPEDELQLSQIIDILDSYLSSATPDPAATVQRLAQSSTASLDDHVWLVFNEILYRIGSSVHDDAIQNQLIELLAAMKSSDGIWKSLEVLGIAVRDLWNGSVEDHGTEGWASLNAFVARVTASETTNFDDYGIWAMRYALEDDSIAPDPTAVMKDGELKPEVLDQHVPAAAVWILYAGDRMRNLSVKGDEGSRSTRGGPLWEGKPGYSKERWNFWKERFSSFSERQDLAVETREISKQAAEKM
ncbi:hypothetical protein C8J56DRAFT_326122 [Mycena floridula]|nr:hypothetical protein C8J56DRAFT_326122 [Mycena floridula]